MDGGRADGRSVTVRRGGSQAVVTFPAFKQEAHTRTRVFEPPLSTRTVWMLGFQRRFVRR